MKENKEAATKPVALVGMSYRAGSAMGKSCALIHASGPRDMLPLCAGDRRFTVIDRRDGAGRPGVASLQQADPPLGTPGCESLRGNSAPALAPVAGRADWLNPKAVG